ncbi:MAG: polymer-forming cytoskeletal protein [Anaerolineae bacterium]|nr:polymer-forming cytoskeletal protein [Anaerolineae bacterium]
MSFFSGRRQSDDIEHNEKTDAPRPYAQQPIGFESVLGASADLEGRLSSKGNLRLDGTFTGTLEIEGNVLVGETAIINADIEARNISIAGAVRGNVTGNKVQLLRTGRIWGDIRATALTTEEGAFIDGRITMIGRDEVEPGKKAETPALEDSTATLSAPPEAPLEGLLEAIYDTQEVTSAPSEHDGSEFVADVEPAAEDDTSEDAPEAENNHF